MRARDLADQRRDISGFVAHGHDDRNARHGAGLWCIGIGHRSVRLCPPAFYGPISVRATLLIRPADGPGRALHLAVVGDDEAEAAQREPVAHAPRTQRPDRRPRQHVAHEMRGDRDPAHRDEQRKAPQVRPRAGKQRADRDEGRESTRRVPRGQAREVRTPVEWLIGEGTRGRWPHPADEALDDGDEESGNADREEHEPNTSGDHWRAPRASCGRAPATRPGPSRR